MLNPASLAIASVLALLAWPQSTATPKAPNAVVILVHGIHSDARDYTAFHEFAQESLGDVWLIDFAWNAGNLPELSEVVGERVSSPVGLTREGWAAVARLKEVITRTRLNVPDETKRVLLTHCQGTVIALAALQEGAEVDTWVLMGSPLSRAATTSNDANTGLSAAFANVRGSTANLYSPVDDITSLLRGGRSRAPSLGHLGSHGLTGSLVGRPDAFDVQVDDVHHFDWWKLAWLRADPEGDPQGRQRVDEFKALLGIGTTPARRSPEIPTKFAAIQTFAANPDTEWKHVCGDGHPFSGFMNLLPGMSNGTHWHGVARLGFTLQVRSGVVEYRVRTARGAKWDRESSTPWQEIDAGDSPRHDAFESEEYLKNTAFLEVRNRSEASAVVHVLAIPEWL